MSFGPDLEWHPKPPRQHQPGTRRRAVKWFLIAIGALTVGFLALVAVVVIQLDGGPRWAFSTAPTQTDKAVVSANAAGGRTLNQTVADLYADAKTAGLDPVAATTPELVCQTGQHNWKRNDDYGLQCDTTVHLIVGATRKSEAGLRTQLLNLDTQLTKAGWMSHFVNSPPMSIKDLVNAPAGTTLDPAFLDRSQTASYRRGKNGTQGSTTLSAEFGSKTKDGAVAQMHVASGGVQRPEFTQTATYLAGHPGRYVINLSVTTITFSG